MNELNEMEMSSLLGGTVTATGAAGSAAVGGITGAVGAAATATTIAALGLPALLGAMVGLTAYLVRDAVEEGILAAQAYRLANK